MPWQWPWEPAKKRKPFALIPGATAGFEHVDGEFTFKIRTEEGVIGVCLLYNDANNKLGLRFISLFAENPVSRIINAYVTLARDIPTEVQPPKGGVM